MSFRAKLTKLKRGILILPALPALAGIAVMTRMHAHTAAPSIKAAVLASPMTTSTSTSTTLSPSGILTSLFGVGMGFLQAILNGFEGLLQSIFGGVGQAITEVFSQWGYTVSGTYGVWAPAGMVLGLGAAAFIGYLVISGIDMEKDVIGAEEDA